MPLRSVSRRFRWHRALSLLLVFALFGCGGNHLLLDEETLGRIAPLQREEHRIVYLDKHFSYTADGRLRAETHSVVKVGTTSSPFPRVLLALDDANEKLLAVEGRITRKDGSTKSYADARFYKHNLSSQERIAEEYARSALIEGDLSAGDLVELATIHELRLPQLGISFSPGELGYPSENVTCSITTKPSERLRYTVVNSPLKPTIHDSSAGTTYHFRWQPYTPPEGDNREMMKRNPAPAVFAVAEQQSWASFGDWYLAAVEPKLRPGTALVETARKLAEGKRTAKEKIDAIFDYCARNVRYEQVYVEHGEIFPNPVDQVFDRKYGDCKDYASLIHVMAASVGVTSQMALCHRGRGVEFFDEIPVSQFNHVLVHFEDAGRSYWYDGTNRSGLPGTASFDLANSRALVLHNGQSRLVTIQESPENLLRISATLAPQAGSTLSGDVTVTFAQQYAVPFFWLHQELNTVAMSDEITRDLKYLLNDDITVRNPVSRIDGETFVIQASCEIPNSLSSLQGQVYASAARIFPNLLPRDLHKVDTSSAFYFPYYNRVALDIGIRTAASDSLASVRLSYQLPSGPFTDANRHGFLTQLDSVIKEYTTPRKLFRVSAQ